MKEYVVLPNAICEDKHALREWLATSLDYTRALPAKQKAKRRRRLEI